jgi:hypothetical protein
MLLPGCKQYVIVIRGEMQHTLTKPMMLRDLSMLLMTPMGILKVQRAYVVVGVMTEFSISSLPV